MGVRPGNLVLAMAPQPPHSHLEVSWAHLALLVLLPSIRTQVPPAALQQQHRFRLQEVLVPQWRCQSWKSQKQGSHHQGASKWRSGEIKTHGVV